MINILSKLSCEDIFHIGMFKICLFKRYKVESTGSIISDMIIESASLDDSGVYSCVSETGRLVDATKVAVIRGMCNTILLDHECLQCNLMKCLPFSYILNETYSK